MSFMADEFDGGVLPAMLQTAFTVSMGAELVRAGRTAGERFTGDRK